RGRGGGGGGGRGLARGQHRLDRLPGGERLSTEPGGPGGCFCREVEPVRFGVIVGHLPRRRRHRSGHGIGRRRLRRGLYRRIYVLAELPNGQSHSNDEKIRRRTDWLRYAFQP